MARGGTRAAAGRNPSKDRDPRDPRDPPEEVPAGAEAEVNEGAPAEAAPPPASAALAHGLQGGAGGAAAAPGLAPLSPSALGLAMNAAAAARVTVSGPPVPVPVGGVGGVGPAGVPGGLAAPTGAAPPGFPPSGAQYYYGHPQAHHPYGGYYGGAGDVAAAGYGERPPALRGSAAGDPAAGGYRAYGEHLLPPQSWGGPVGLPPPMAWPAQGAFGFRTPAGVGLPPAAAAGPAAALAPALAAPAAPAAAPVEDPDIDLLEPNQEDFERALLADKPADHTNSAQFFALASRSADILYFPEGRMPLFGEEKLKRDTTLDSLAPPKHVMRVSDKQRLCICSLEPELMFPHVDMERREVSWTFTKLKVPACQEVRNTATVKKALENYKYTGFCPLHVQGEADGSQEAYAKHGGATVRGLNLGRTVNDKRPRHMLCVQTAAGRAFLKWCTQCHNWQNVKKYIVEEETGEEGARETVLAVHTFCTVCHARQVQSREKRRIERKKRKAEREAAQAEQAAQYKQAQKTFKPWPQSSVDLLGQTHAAAAAQMMYPGAHNVPTSSFM